MGDVIMKLTSVKKKGIPMLLVGGILAGTGIFTTSTASAAELPAPAVSNEKNESVIQYGATTNRYKGYVKSSTVTSKKYMGTVTKTNGWAFNIGITIKGVSIGGGKTYSEIRNFREYKVTRKYVMHFDVYNGIGQKINSYDETHYATTTEYERA